MEVASLFPPPEMWSGSIVPRPYQIEAHGALDLHMRTKEGNPLVVIPTGGGKSVLMAWSIQGWKIDYPPFRCIILAHRKELVEQNAAELARLWPGGDIGVFAAGLRRYDRDNSITYASIDSVYKKWGEFEPFDVIIVDEAHRIPAKGEGKYRQFINGCKSQNENLRVIGYTATPFRMGQGVICHRDHILNEICYEANIVDLIEQGYLCKLRSKIGDIQPDITGVRKNSGGDYITTSLASAVDTPDIVRKAIKSAVEIIQSENRKSIMFFCVDVSHCRDVSMELRKYGIDAPMVTGQTPARERKKIAEAFKHGVIRAISNVNVYTEGFDAKRVDCIVLLRPTLSAGLYLQMVGRGLRIHPEKTDCIVLDYAKCILEHGPINCIDSGKVKMTKCANCGDDFSRVIGVCPNCGWEIPKQQIEREDAEERERKMHEIRHSNLSIISGEPETIEVDAVTVHRHRKLGKPDSLRVQYRCGLSTFPEWVCLDHPGFAGQKAKAWWSKRFVKSDTKHMTVDKALSFDGLQEFINEITETVTVIRRGKHFEIVGYKFKESQIVNA